MKMKASPVWIGALVAGSTAAFYFWQKKSNPNPTQPLADAGTSSGASSPQASSATPSNSGNRTPSASNGHVRDVKATDLPAPDTGTNFTKHGDVHEPSNNE